MEKERLGKPIKDAELRGSILRHHCIHRDPTFQEALGLTTFELDLCSRKEVPTLNQAGECSYTLGPTVSCVPFDLKMHIERFETTSAQGKHILGCVFSACSVKWSLQYHPAAHEPF